MMKKSHSRIRRIIFPAVLFVAATLIAPEISFAMDAAQLYGSKCSACHGSKGEGSQVGPALKGDPFITKGTAAEIKKVILMGRMDKDKKYPNFMTAMPGGLASEAEADALVAYLQSELQK
jgi:mono/diheme cytochrome c family protein